MRQTMKNGWRTILIGIAAIAALIVGFMAFYQRPAEVGRQKHTFDFDSVDQEFRPYALLAAKEFAKKQGMTSIDQAMTGREVSVERSEGGICVRLVVVPPGMGESPIYCYDEATSQLMRKFDDVE
ncbi:hypothetical protein [Sphingosinicella soli]|uniref:Uncharacterized protein n=1 Tax=Sphingosinicella soli TaxID=333708 RepID=A0A7W7B247_9SPHN|nr:hypothetical protein [Sphingosinicella soli]MBB4632604.1 hypothetical protein [Sphingosinicella soli]